MSKQSNDQNRGNRTGAFWAWAVDKYALPGVSDSLIALQDQAGLNVNLSLWACWTATLFGDLSEADIRNAFGAIAAWHEGVTKTLRAARRSAKPFEARPDFPTAKALRAAVKAAELDAERVEIDILERCAYRDLSPAGGGDEKARARKNFDLYAAFAGCEGVSSELRQHIIDHIFAAPKGPALSAEERDRL